MIKKITCTQRSNKMSVIKRFKIKKINKSLGENSKIKMSNPILLKTSYTT